jgi:glutamate 5-kinase
MIGQQWKRIVVKVGSALIAPDDQGCSTRYLLSIAHFIQQCQQQGVEVILVSSGAVAAGRQAIPFPHPALPITIKQAMAAIGQQQMMQLWGKLLDRPCAQILVTHADFEQRNRYINIANTIRALLQYHAVPVFNENDSVATRELKVGDNDNLAALVAMLTDADALLICSDVDGLFTANPRLDPTATLVPEVSSITPAIFAMAGGSHHSVGTGGMLTKLQAAAKATAAGIATVILNGQQATQLNALAQGQSVGTLFLPQQERRSARKHWLLQTARSQGQLVLDAGAVTALSAQGASLLGKGVVQVLGDFDKGDSVTLHSQCADGTCGASIGIGVSQYSAAELRQIMGLHSSHIADVLGYCPSETVIHRDDLVLHAPAL